jgi:hypothetical protein
MEGVLFRFTCRARIVVIRQARDSINRLKEYKIKEGKLIEIDRGQER